MDYKNLIAIDIHTHAEVSCRNPFDNYGEEYDRAADKFFGSDRRPTIDETVAYYREKKIGLVMFTVDSESQLGRRRIPNEEISDAAKANSDMMIAFASIDPHKGKMGAREAERLIKENGSVDNNYRLPSDVTLKHASKLAVVEDKPIMLDYWTASLDKKSLIGVKESGEKLLVKSEDEYTSPISKFYKSGTEYIIITENSIYLVSSDIPTRKIT